MRLCSHLIRFPCGGGEGRKAAPTNRRGARHHPPKGGGEQHPKGGGGGKQHEWKLFKSLNNVSFWRCGDTTTHKRVAVLFPPPHFGWWCLPSKILWAVPFISSSAFDPLVLWVVVRSSSSGWLCLPSSKTTKSRIQLNDMICLSNRRCTTRERATAPPLEKGEGESSKPKSGWWWCHKKSKMTRKEMFKKKNKNCNSEGTKRKVEREEKNTN